MADLAVAMAGREDDVELDAVGPDVFAYDDLVRLIGRKAGVSARLMRTPAWMALGAANLLGLFVRDIVLSRDEIEGLSGDLLVSRSGEPPPGKTRLADWLDENGDRLGTAYSSELDRHYR